MSTSRLSGKLLETRFVWAETMPEAMEFAMAISRLGRWQIQGNPSPMTYNGKYGTGVAVTRVTNDE